MTDRSNEQWIADLRMDGDAQAEAITDLKRRLERGIYYYLSRERSDLSDLRIRTCRCQPARHGQDQARYERPGTTARESSACGRKPRKQPVTELAHRHIPQHCPTSNPAREVVRARPVTTGSRTGHDALG